MFSSFQIIKQKLLTRSSDMSQREELKLTAPRLCPLKVINNNITSQNLNIFFSVSAPAAAWWKRKRTELTVQHCQQVSSGGKWAAKTAAKLLSGDRGVWRTSWGRWWRTWWRGSSACWRCDGCCLGVTLFRCSSSRSVHPASLPLCPAQHRTTPLGLEINK